MGDVIDMPVRVPYELWQEMMDSMDAAHDMLVKLTELNRLLVNDIERLTRELEEERGARRTH